MFDPSAPHIIILLIVVLLLFGSSRLPGAANALGRSMHIFKRSVSGLNEDQDSAANPAGSQPTAGGFFTGNAPQAAPIAAPDPHAQQLADLQRQVADLQKQNAAGNGAQASEAQSGQSL